MSIRIGGEEHSGWLPAGAVKPLPTPVRDVLVDIEIERNGPNDCLLICAAQDGSFCWDDWFQSIDDAERAAKERYGIESRDWTTDRA
ncbi:MAG TPA: hypothetical protein VHD36_21295 [Pirellulales bacterium]|nr:hypothetical protein [Pirellulales bacterium]